MPTPGQRYLSGLLLEWPREPVQVSHLIACKEVMLRGVIAGSRWEEFNFRSEKALQSEDRFNVPGPYTYTIVCRRSGTRLLLLAPDRAVASYLAHEVLAPKFLPGLRPVSIAVDDLVKAVVERPTDYVLSFVHARVPAFGASLRAVSFYGDDLAEAPFFRDNLGLLTPFTVGLRRAIGGPELLRLSGDGFLSFYLNAPAKVLEVEEVLAFLRKHGYLTTEILRENAE